jgi:uncharacterized protein
MSILKLPWILLLLSCILPSVAQECNNKIVIGERIQLYSPVLKQERTITIHLPNNYSRRTRYPVLYLLDGLAQFVTAVDVSGQSYVGVIPEMIIVAVDYIDRTKEFTPTHLDEYPTSGGADQFIDFMEKDLFSYVDSEYSTMPFRILAGHSLAGLLVTYALFSDKNLFNAYLAMDPSLWWDKELLVEMVKKSENDPLKNRFLYTSSTSTNEQNIQDFEKALRSITLEGLQYKFESFMAESHGSVIFVSLYYGLKYIFADYTLTDAYKDTITSGKNPEFIHSHYSSFSQKAGIAFLPPEDVIIRLGYSSMGDKDFDNAIKIFGIVLSYYPGSFKAYNGLADAFNKKGDKKTAVINYKKALELNPKDENAKNRIMELEINK